VPQQRNFPFLVEVFGDSIKLRPCAMASMFQYWTAYYTSHRALESALL